MTNSRIALATLLGLAAAACTDTVGPASGAGAPVRFAVVVVPYDGDPPEPVQPPPSTSVPEATPEELAYLPPEYRIETMFLHHSTEASFNGAMAYAEGRMQWKGNRGEQQLTMTLRGPDGTFDRTFTSAGGNGYPWSENSLHTPGQYQTFTECGNILDATTKHTIWNQMRLPDGVSRDGITLAEVRWSTKERTTYPLYEARQPRCANGTSGAKPISNPEGGGTVCRTITVEHYWYYPDTNTYEYRYTDTRYECGQQSTAGSGPGGEIAG